MPDEFVTALKDSFDENDKAATDLPLKLISAHHYRAEELSRKLSLLNVFQAASWRIQ